MPFFSGLPNPFADAIEDFIGLSKGAGFTPFDPGADTPLSGGGFTGVFRDRPGVGRVTDISGLSTQFARPIEQGAHDDLLPSVLQGLPGTDILIDALLRELKALALGQIDRSGTSGTLAQFEDFNIERAAEVAGVTNVDVDEFGAAVDANVAPQSPYVPHMPGQMPVGFNPNDPFVIGGTNDPGGPINPQGTWASRDTIETILGVEIPDPSDPAVWKEVGKYWLGQALERLRDHLQTNAMDKAQRQASLRRQLMLQNAFDQFISRAFSSINYNERSVRQEMTRLGVPTQLPMKSEPKPQRVVVCGTCKENCKCHSDSH